ncbi:hypothetical protein ACFV2N_31855 [Streptomyces sp. NPDC059680]|uniref:hypothetical protein n=1 Tax=Streptomyces sp. NPDC059680 TaxID=3346904 RepID=UPI0036BC197B
MIERPSASEEPRPSASFNSSPSDTGRAYQAAGSQHFHEHHYHGPVTNPAPAVADRPSKGRPGPVWVASIAVVTLVALASGGVWLWPRLTSAHATAGGDKTPHSAGAPVPGRSSASPSAKTRNTTPKASSGSAESSTPSEGPIPDTQSSVPAPASPPNPADPKNCRSWKTLTDMANVQVRPCWRREGSRIYMVGEWHALQGVETVDVYLWLKDASGQAVYPASNALSWRGKGAYPASSSEQQWEQAVVPVNLVQGAEYTVCISVYPAGHVPPVITNPEVSGTQKSFTY